MKILLISILSLSILACSNGDKATNIKTTSASLKQETTIAEILEEKETEIDNQESLKNQQFISDLMPILVSSEDLWLDEEVDDEDLDLVREIPFRIYRLVGDIDDFIGEWENSEDQYKKEIIKYLISFNKDFKQLSPLFIEMLQDRPSDSRVKMISAEVSVLKESRIEFLSIANEISENKPYLNDEGKELLIAELNRISPKTKSHYTEWLLNAEVDDFMESLVRLEGISYEQIALVLIMLELGAELETNLIDKNCPDKSDLIDGKCICKKGFLINFSTNKCDRIYTSFRPVLDFEDSDTEEMQTVSAENVVWNYFEGLINESYETSYEALSVKKKEQSGTYEAFREWAEGFGVVRDVTVLPIMDANANYNIERVFNVKFRLNGEPVKWQFWMKLEDGYWKIDLNFEKDS